MLTLARLGWGQENPAFRQLFTSLFIPGGTKEQADWFNELQRVSTSPENAARNLEIMGDIDVTDLLPRVTVPTLVMHARDEVRVPFDAGRRMAAGIPGARFVPLQSRNHLFLETEPAFTRFLEEVHAFRAGLIRASPARPPGPGCRGPGATHPRSENRQRGLGRFATGRAAWRLREASRAAPSGCADRAP